VTAKKCQVLLNKFFPCVDPVTSANHSDEALGSSQLKCSGLHPKYFGFQPKNNTVQFQYTVFEWKEDTPLFICNKSKHFCPSILFSNKYDFLSEGNFCRKFYQAYHVSAPLTAAETARAIKAIKKKFFWLLWILALVTAACKQSLAEYHEGWEEVLEAEKEELAHVTKKSSNRGLLYWAPGWSCGSTCIAEAVAWLTTYLGEIKA